VDDKLSVKTICQLTGINEHTLRAWERRYAVVQPKRLDNGRRIYSIEDLEKLKLVALLVQKGFLIGNIANQTLHQLSKLLNEAAQTPDMIDSASRQQSRADELSNMIEEALHRYDLIRINILLQQAKAEYGIREYLFAVVLPLMVRVGDYVYRGELTIGQEHALSAIVKYHLLQVFYLLTHSHAMLNDSKAPKSFAVATSEGNLHEFGILVAAVLCAYHGYPVFYLGPNTPADALSDATAAIGANCIILGLSTINEFAYMNRAFVGNLLDKLPSVCELWLGGSSDPQLASDVSGRMKTLPSLEELDRLLANIKKT